METRAWIVWDNKNETFNIVDEDGKCLTYFNDPEDLSTWVADNCTELHTPLNILIKEGTRL